MKNLLIIALSLTTIMLAASCSKKGSHLFILSGQSNMAGLDPNLSFTPAVIEKFGTANVIVVKDAQGGQPIRRWHKGWELREEDNPKQIGDLYDQLLAKVKSAIEGKTLQTVTFLWMQGERDAREELADRYTKSLEGMIEQLKSDLNRKDLNIVIGRLSDFDMGNKAYPHWTRLREIQVAYAEAHPNAEWVDTDDLNDGLNKQGKAIKDDLHYSVSGYIKFGERLAEKAIQLIEK